MLRFKFLMTRLSVFYLHLIHKGHIICHKVVHRGHEVFHYIYLGAVSIEAHGWYGKAAMGLLVFTVLAAFFGEHAE